ILESIGENIIFTCPRTIQSVWVLRQAAFDSLLKGRFHQAPDIPQSTSLRRTRGLITRRRLRDPRLNLGLAIQLSIAESDSVASTNLIEQAVYFGNRAMNYNTRSSATRPVALI